MSDQKKSLTGKRVVLLGASSGIGLETARMVAAEGAQVVIVSSKLSKIENALKSLPSDAEGFAVDLSVEQNIRDFFKQIGSLDHLVFSAGENLTLNNIESTDITQARDFFTIRFWAAVAAVKYSAPLIRPGGSISLTSGTASTRPGSGWSIASAICGAMEGFVRAMAVELSPIRVNCVMPGVIKTPLWDSLPEADREALYAHTADSLLVKRVGECADVASGFLYLINQSYATGQTLAIDGGALLV
ncbi:SDR family oxidoreductase [Pedobacter sp. PF22-3]|uniref:SDR family oxidoreductase n=1 Tax=Pedobacter sp. PF22-3 TaxID=2994467 RepID=UPI002245323F|nr:SDR family oxidoreductase [Pedobacter sp. PF22-3]MCX2495287.1 SDR family oxidoreductase [Pedobacter sp. PF22-3]